MNRLLAIVLAGILFPVAAFAQTDNPYFGDIASQVDTGERAIVWTMSGEKVRGRVIDVSADAIDLRLKGQDIRLLAQDVRRVERAGDRIWNGAGIGGAIGFAFGAVSMATCDPGLFCDRRLPSILACGGMAGAFGFGVGALGDWLVRSDRLIFDRGNRAARLSVVPLVSVAGSGMTLRMTF